MGTIVGLGVLATLVNMFGAVHKGDGITDAVMGGFVVTTILLLVGQTKAKPIASLFMLAFLITSLATNGAPLFSTISDTVQGKNKGMDFNNG